MAANWRDRLSSLYHAALERAPVERQGADHGEADREFCVSVSGSDGGQTRVGGVWSPGHRETAFRICTIGPWSVQVRSAERSCKRRAVETPHCATNWSRCYAMSPMLAIPRAASGSRRQ